MLININNKLKMLLITLIVLSNNLFSARYELENNQLEQVKKKQKIKPTITRDMAINIGKFLPGDDKFLNELVRLYPAEQETYRNIAQKLIEKKIIINNDKNISSLLDEHFKTSKINDLKLKLNDNIYQLSRGNYPLLIEKQNKYLISLSNNKKYWQYFNKREEILNIYKNIYQEIKYKINFEPESEKQIEYYINTLNLIKESINKLSFYDRLNLDKEVAIINIATSSAYGCFLAKVLSTVIDIPEYGLVKAYMLGMLNLKYFLNLGLYLSAIGSISVINFCVVKKIVTKIIFNKKNKLVSEGQNLINQIEVLKNQI